jgi:hypothetical protein
MSENDGQNVPATPVAGAQTDDAELVAQFEQILKGEVETEPQSKQGIVPATSGDAPVVPPQPSDGQGVNKLASELEAAKHQLTEVNKQLKFAQKDIQGRSRAITRIQAERDAALAKLDRETSKAKLDALARSQDGVLDKSLSDVFSVLDADYEKKSTEIVQKALTSEGTIIRDNVVAMLKDRGFNPDDMINPTVKKVADLWVQKCNEGDVSTMIDEVSAILESTSTGQPTQQASGNVPQQPKSREDIESELLKDPNFLKKALEVVREKRKASTALNVPSGAGASAISPNINPSAGTNARDLIKSGWEEHQRKSGDGNRPREVVIA